MHVCAYKLFIFSTNQFNIISVDGCPFGVSVQYWCYHKSQQDQLVTVVSLLGEQL